MVKFAGFRLVTQLQNSAIVESMADLCALARFLDPNSSKIGFGAGDGIRTRNPQLGKLMRYRCATPAQKGEEKIVKDLIRVNPR